MGYEPEPEFCELFVYEPTFFGSQKIGSQKFDSQKVGSQKFGSQNIWNFFMVHIFPKFTNFR
jgi:hypothetical protein